MGGKKKFKKKLQEPEQVYYVKLVDQTSPKFAHNAWSAGKDVVWTYEYWLGSQPRTRGRLEITMDVRKMRRANENTQSRQMNDDAIAAIKAEYPGFEVKLTSR